MEHKLIMDRVRRRILERRAYTDASLGAEREFPLLSVAIGICHNRERELKNFAQVAALGAELKKAAKTKAGSAYVVDRRRAADETSR